MRELSTSSLYVNSNGNNNLKTYKMLLGSIPLDAMRNNSSKLVNQDMDVVPLEEMNLTPVLQNLLGNQQKKMHTFGPNAGIFMRFSPKVCKNC